MLKIVHRDPESFSLSALLLPYLALTHESSKYFITRTFQSMFATMSETKLDPFSGCGMLVSCIARIRMPSELLHKEDIWVCTTYEPRSKKRLERPSTSAKVNNYNGYRKFVLQPLRRRVSSQSRSPHRSPRPRFHHHNRPPSVHRPLPHMDSQDLLPNNGLKTGQAHRLDGSSCPCCRPALFHMDEFHYYAPGLDEQGASSGLLHCY